jgi:hypothetical protein
MIVLVHPHHVPGLVQTGSTSESYPAQVAEVEVILLVQSVE